MKKRKPDVRFGTPSAGNDLPISAETKCKISISMENRSVQLPRLGQITDNKKKQWFVGRNSTCRVVIQIA
jgi:hypothetical protein